MLASAALVMFALGLLRGPTPGGVDGRTVAEAIALARGTPILTTDVPAEQIALAGGRVWASNPIDAFAPRVQLSYLEWTDGDRAGLTAVARDVRVVLVGRGSPSAALMRHQPDFRLVAQRRTYELFEKNG